MQAKINNVKGNKNFPKYSLVSQSDTLKKNKLHFKLTFVSEM